MRPATITPVLPIKLVAVRRSVYSILGTVVATHCPNFVDSESPVHSFSHHNFNRCTVLLHSFCLCSFSRAWRYVHTAPSHFYSTKVNVVCLVIFFFTHQLGSVCVCVRHRNILSDWLPCGVQIADEHMKITQTNRLCRMRISFTHRIWSTRNTLRFIRM